MGVQFFGTMSKEAGSSDLVDQVFAKLAPDEKTAVIIATRKGALIKTNRSQEIGKTYAAWASSMCKNTNSHLSEEVRLMRVATTDSEITISTIPHSQFLLVTVHSDKVTETTSEA